MGASSGKPSRRGRIATVAGLALVGAALGFAAAYQLMEDRVARSEQANRDLRSALGTLEEGLRTARAPLERRLAQLEGALEGALGSAPPPPAEPDMALQARIDALEGQLAEQSAAKPDEQIELVAAREALSEEQAALEATRRRLEQEQEALRTEHAAVQRDRDAVTEERDRLREDLALVREERDQLFGQLADARRRSETLAARIEAGEPAPALAAPAPGDIAFADDVPEPTPTTPAVSAPPPIAPFVSAAPGCTNLTQPDFVITDLDNAARRLGDRLVLRVQDGPGGPMLRVGDGRERYPLEATPQHVSFDCEGTSYIVSVCDVEAEPLRVSGEIRSGEDWRPPCR